MPATYIASPAITDDERFLALIETVSKVANVLAVMDQRLDEMDKRFDSIELRLISLQETSCCAWEEGEVIRATRELTEIESNTRQPVRP